MDAHIHGPGVGWVEMNYDEQETCPLPCPIIYQGWGKPSWSWGKGGLSMGEIFAITTNM